MIIDDLFKYPSYRMGQKEAIHNIWEAMHDNDKHYVFLDAPTGFGKSPVAYNIADASVVLNNHNVYLLTATKMLQNQYVIECDNDNHVSYSVGLGRGNFYCGLNDNPCTDGECKRKDPDEKFSCPYGMRNNNPMDNGGCEYWACKGRTIASDVAILNYNVLMSDLAYVGHYGHRDLMIADEAHNIESKIMNEISISLSERTLNKQLGFTFKDKDFDELSIKYWLDKINILIGNCELRIDNHQDFGLNQKGLDSLISLKGDLEWKYSEIENNPREWVVCPNKFQRNISIKPIKIKKWAYNKLFSASDYHVLMSGTFIDYEQFCNDLGINIDDTAYVRAESSFDMVTHNPIKEAYCGSMGYSSKQRTLPATIPVIKSILDKHEGECGLIHANSMEFTKYIMNNINSDRLITYDSLNKDSMINEFKDSDDKVMVSYSLQEGLNLPYDGIRFQVFYKVPYPFLGDNQIKARLKLDPNWYNMKTVQIIIQAWGRGMRAEDDYCMNYLLDSNFKNVIYGNRFRHLLPNEFKEAVLLQNGQSTLV